jgi:hypothetical protein
MKTGLKTGDAVEARKYSVGQDHSRSGERTPPATSLLHSDIPTTTPGPRISNTHHIDLPPNTFN